MVTFPLLRLLGIDSYQENIGERASWESVGELFKVKLPELKQKLNDIHDENGKSKLRKRIFEEVLESLIRQLKAM